MKIIASILAFSFILAGGSLIPVAAQQNNQCAPRNQVVEHLGRKYNEILSFQGITDNGLGLIEIFVNPDPKIDTWTIVVTDAKTKLSCLVSAGTSWSARTKKSINAEKLNYDSVPI